MKISNSSCKSKSKLQILMHFSAEKCWKKCILWGTRNKKSWKSFSFKMTFSKSKEICFQKHEIRQCNSLVKIVDKSKSQWICVEQQGSLRTYKYLPIQSREKSECFWLLAHLQWVSSGQSYLFLKCQL